MGRGRGKNNSNSLSSSEVLLGRGARNFSFKREKMLKPLSALTGLKPGSPGRSWNDYLFGFATISGPNQELLIETPAYKIIPDPLFQEMIDARLRIDVPPLFGAELLSYRDLVYAPALIHELKEFLRGNAFMIS